MPAIVALVIMLVGSSVARALSLAGAFALAALGGSGVLYGKACRGEAMAPLEV